MEENIGHYIDVWKKIVDVQQHFNDIEMRVRAIAIPTLAAMLGAAGFAHKEHVNIAILGTSVPAAFAIAILTLVIWLAFYVLDRHWYHRLLYGAVYAAIPIEAAIRKVLPELDLGGEISKHSQITFKLFGKKRTLRSTHKMDLIYGVIAILIIFVALAFWLSGPVPAAVTVASPS